MKDEGVPKGFLHFERLPAPEFGAGQGGPIELLLLHELVLVVLIVPPIVRVVFLLVLQWRLQISTCARGTKTKQAPIISSQSKLRSYFHYLSSIDCFK